MKKKYTAQSFSAALALAMLLLTASCQNNIAEPEPELPVNPALPGNASPNGGNEPGVEFTLTTPVISIGATAANTRSTATAQPSPSARGYGEAGGEVLPAAHSEKSLPRQENLPRPLGTPSQRGTAAQSRAAADMPLAGISKIILYVDLLKADGTVTQSCRYLYTDESDNTAADGTWTVDPQEGEKPAPLRVNGGNGVYYMRASANVTTFRTAAEGLRSLQMSYTGTATVTGDQTSGGATFTFGKSLSPYTAAVEVRLTDADGNEISSEMSSSSVATHSKAYEVYLRGMAITSYSPAAISYEWISDGTRPVRCSARTQYNKIFCLSRTGPARYTAVDVLPGSVPGCWPADTNYSDLAYTPYSQADADKYTGFLGDTDGKHLLFSIYQKEYPYGDILTTDDATGLPNVPAEIKKTYHVAAPTTSGITGYTLAPGKLYRFNVSLGSKPASIVSIDVSDFVTSTGGDIDISNRP